MTRYFFHISYKGTNYRGWQRQKKVLTIQEIFETKLEQVFKYKIPCLGCGRTDAGVHAAQYFFHIDLKKEIDFDLKFRLNKMLPHDISVYDVIKMEQDYHAQFDASERTYDYFIHTYKEPFLSNQSSFYLFDELLDLKKMNQAVLMLLKYHDFKAFCKTPDKHDNTICNIKGVKLFKNDSGDRIRFQITANKFLKSMIRIIVYRLLEIGSDKLSVDEFEHFLVNKEPSKFNNLAYPQGLYLSRVKYEFLDITPKNDFSNILNNYWQVV
ncbi:MAG: tRNA pseudouridine(38-40) synthase TruA [Bacteroidales bacterium]|nr:tRNA pseudouridine(38-40) synthase TruA [Bacteroidales bacterium]